MSLSRNLQGLIRFALKGWYYHIQSWQFPAYCFLLVWNKWTSVAWQTHNEISERWQVMGREAKSLGPPYSILHKVPFSGALIFTFFPTGSYRDGGLSVLDTAATIRQAPSRALSWPAAQTSGLAHLFITTCSPGSEGKTNPNLKPFPSNLESNPQSPASLQRDQQSAPQLPSFPRSPGLLVGLPGEPRSIFLGEITACFYQTRPQRISFPSCANLLISPDTNNEWVLQGMDDLRACHLDKKGEGKKGN